MRAGYLVIVMTLREELATIYSDTYKDYYGVRPRGWGEWSAERLAAALEDLRSRPLPDLDDDEPYWDESGEVDHVMATQPTSGEGWSYTPVSI